MGIAVAYLVTGLLLFSTLLTFGRDTMVTFEDNNNSWVGLEARSERKAETRITGPSGLSVQSAPRVQITIANRGDVSLAQFSDWDVIVETQRSAGLGITYLTHTASTTPAKNQWAVQGIYRNAASSTPETVEPGVLNPGEEMVVLANPAPAFGADTYGRAVLTTPNGAAVKVVLFKPTVLYVLDQTDLLVYRYRDSGTFLGTSALDGQNASSTGITTHDFNFWVTDIQDDVAYKYSHSFSLVTSWAHDPLNHDATGMTTDGSNIWLVDSQDLKVYKYDMSGTLVSEFPLTAANANPTGIGSGGANLWVVDSDDDKAYKYDLSGAFVSSFILAAANSDPTGISSDGTNIWVVDAVDVKIYEYDMSGAFISDFSLTGANGDPQGLTVIPR